MKSILKNSNHHIIDININKDSFGCIPLNIDNKYKQKNK